MDFIRLLINVPSRLITPSESREMLAIFVPTLVVLTAWDKSNKKQRGFSLILQSKSDATRTAQDKK